MANRHLSRSVAMQTLFEWDFNECDKKDIDALIERNIKQFAPGLEDSSFVYELAQGVVKKQDKIDKIIEKAAPEWPIKQIAIVDRNVIRLGLYELLFGKRDEVPAKVAINEAIELAKTFGGVSSGKFVNGVLGTVYKELGLPEDDGPTKKEMPKEQLGGAVVYIKKNEKIMLAFVHDVFGYWTLSKGHIEGEESAKEATVREVKEEIGIDIKIEDKLGSNEYVASDPEKGKIKKIVTYFLASTENENLVLKETGGLDGVRWFNLGEISDLKIYDDIRPIITSAIKILNTKNK